ncbi:hypothetical protein BDY17DRAFT_313488 [Neohortaea acidophila]|uniref:Uncharacterized protein n=1 Tax=Neohortaea acidophila TaxID=245834 RepID=A0A6A6PJ69_9PEZI|nr:uncharacterized protein BDY17DRAFT_313488 [Neohortaea acidophila]KAF2479744.1 hypothetical protein BDY17DRAFT_313488 [Neohortaea acidophila]
MPFGFRFSFNLSIGSNEQPDEVATEANPPPIADKIARRRRVAQTTRAARRDTKQQHIADRQRANMPTASAASTPHETDHASLHRLMYHTHRLEMQRQYFQAPFKSTFDLGTYRSSSPENRQGHQEALITLGHGAERQLYFSLSDEEFEDRLSRDIAAGKAEESLTTTSSMLDLKERLLAAGWSEESIEAIASWSAGLASRENEAKSVHDLFGKVEKKDAEEEERERLVQVAGGHQSMVGGFGDTRDHKDALEVDAKLQSPGEGLAGTTDEASKAKEAESGFDEFVDCRSQQNSDEEEWCLV